MNSINLRYSSSSSPTSRVKIDNKNYSTIVTETSIPRTRSSPCFFSSSKSTSKYSVSIQNNFTSKKNNKV